MKKCIVCGKELTRKQKTFCSRVCLYKFQNKSLKRLCNFCKKEIYVKQCRKKRVSFCSHLCYSKWQMGKPNKSKIKFGESHTPWNKDKKGVMPEPWNKGREWVENQGENHWNWRGGKTELRQVIRHTYIYKQWRTSIFIRDNYTCCKCGNRCRIGNKITLNVHHKKAFYRIIDEYKIKTAEDAKNCAELWDLKNGETLCTACHKQTDSYLVNQHTK